MTFVFNKPSDFREYVRRFDRLKYARHPWITNTTAIMYLYMELWPFLSLTSPT